MFLFVDRWKIDFKLQQTLVSLLVTAVEANRSLEKKLAPTPSASVEDVHLSTNQDDGIQLINKSSAASLLPAEEEGLEQKKDLTKQDTSFVRQSTKYWVAPCDLAAVVTVLAEHLDVHIFEKGGPLLTAVSSVYLDNFQRNCYKSRIVKDTGARAFRLRTYNDSNSVVWAERKIHHEKWTGDISSKDRFKVKYSEVMPLLRGQSMSHLPAKQQPLVDEVQQMVTSMQLFPQVDK